MAKERDKRKNAVSRLVQLVQLVQSVEGSREFLEWRKGNKSAHLSSVFAMGKSAVQLGEWLLSYYDAKDDTFTTFSTTGSLMAAKEQAFKKGKAVPVLEAGSVKVEVHDSFRIAEKVRSGNYKGEEANTIIAILQPLTREEVSGGSAGSGNSSGKESEARARPVWNITYITASFNVINIKIDAETGKVLNHRISGVMDFMQKDK